MHKYLYMYMYWLQIVFCLEILAVTEKHSVLGQFPFYSAGWKDRASACSPHPVHKQGTTTSCAPPTCTEYSSLEKDIFF